MIVKSLYLLFLLTFLVLPFFYHRKKSKPSMTKFYLRMAFSHNFRKCYRLVLLSTLLMFHFYHLSLFKLPLELAPSSVVCLLLFSHRISERVFRFLQQERTLLGVAVYPSLPVAWRYHWRTDFRGGVLPLIVGLPHGKEALFKTIVFRES